MEPSGSRGGEWEVGGNAQCMTFFIYDGGQSRADIRLI